MSGIEERWVNVDGRKVFYRERSGAGATVLLLHGNSSSGSAFVPIMESEAVDGLRLLALDLPGHGRSESFSSAEDYTFPGYAAFMRKALAAIGLRPDYYWGWSLGGHIVLEALAALGTARGLIIQGSPPLAGPQDLGDAFQAHPCGAAFFASEVAEDVLTGWADALLRTSNGHSARLEAEREYRHTDPNARVGLGASIVAGDFLDEYEAIQKSAMPLLILHGQEDPFVSRDFVMGAAGAWRPLVETRLLAGVGHSPNVENPKMCAEILADFVRKNGHN